MMNNPQFLQQMSSLLSNPDVVEQVIASNPQFAAMAPQVRQMFQSEHFREMMYVNVDNIIFWCLSRCRANPERLQQMLRMATAFQGTGGTPFGNSFGSAAPSFPAPGNPNAASPTPGATSPNAQNLAPNPFNLFGAPGAGGAAPGAGGAGTAPNPFAFDPALMQQMMGMNSFGAGGGGFGTPPAPADTRPPEERFQVQLQVCPILFLSSRSL